MGLRCLLFTADEGAAEPICQVLAGLEVEGEHCAEAVSAVEKVTHESFQIVIIDWDAQPEAVLLLAAARERKAAARPLTLAIVSDDASVPEALKAGANSVLRKPIMVNQVNDTLTTARDLLRAKQESAATAAYAAAAGVGASSTRSVVAPANVPSIDAGNEKMLRAGEFLQTSGTIPGAQFVTDSDLNQALETSAEPVDPHEDLEPVAASVAEEKPEAPAAPAAGEPRGLQWYLNARAATAPAPVAPASPASSPKPSSKPDLLAFDQTPSYSEESSPVSVEDDAGWAPPPAPAAAAPVARPAPRQDPEHEQKAEAKLFAYIAGEEEKAEEKPKRSFRLGKGPIFAALTLAACAVAGAPQAPWHPQVRAMWAHGQQALHAWLNPTPVTTAQAPVSHESFNRAGDEYKLPATENIPDATTDPSQIRVVPMVDPTAKKPNPDPNAPADATNTSPTDTAQPAPAQDDQGATNPGQASQASPNQVQPSQAQPNQAPQTTAPENQSAPQTVVPATTSGTTTSPTATVSAPAAEPPHADPVATVAAQPVQPKNPQPHSASAPANVPSSLKSQMASMTPEASGNKPPEAAMQSIEPVAVTEAAERALLTEQPAIEYPANAKGQQGTVILQVLIGRDGTVQDAKFLQGSLAFARTAIDGVKLWKFKPYSMNGRAVSVQTSMTMSFKPGS